MALRAEERICRACAGRGLGTAPSSPPWPRSSSRPPGIPGGESRDFASPFYANQLGRWLTNRYHPAAALSPAQVESTP